MTISIAVLIRHIDHHNHAIGRTLFVPAMESDELGPIVKMVDMEILAAQPPRHTRQIAPQGNQIPVHSENAMFVFGS